MNLASIFGEKKWQKQIKDESKQEVYIKLFEGLVTQLVENFYVFIRSIYIYIYIYICIKGWVQVTHSITHYPITYYRIHISKIL